MRNRRLGVLLTLVVLGCATLSCQGSERPARPVDIGMTLHLRGADAQTVKREFELMAAMGVAWVRMDVDWSVVEAEPGQLNWTQPDTIVSAAAEHGMQVLATLAYSPAWVAPPTTDDPAHANHFRPADMAAYGSFARLAAERYLPRGVRVWEVWNEPNTGQFWPPVPEPGEYGRLFRVAAEQIRRVDPEATVLIGGLAPQFDSPSVATTPATYLEQLYLDGAAHIADGVAAHPYSFPALPSEGTGQVSGGFKDLPALHAVMDDHGDGDKKIWITEFGAPTGTSPQAVTQQRQATILLHARRQVGRWDWAGPLIYYELVDGGTDPVDKEQNFGVLRQDLTAKVAALALMSSDAR